MIQWYNKRVGDSKKKKSGEIKARFRSWIKNKAHFLNIERLIVVAPRPLSKLPIKNRSCRCVSVQVGKIERPVRSCKAQEHVAF